MKEEKSNENLYVELHWRIPLILEITISFAFLMAILK